MHRRVDALVPFKGHALRALEEHEVLDARLAEGHQRQVHARGIVACEPVFQLGGLAQHVDQRLAMFDDEGRLGLRPSAAHRQDLREATTPGAAGQITHSGHRLTSASSAVDLRAELSLRGAPERNAFV